MNRTKFRRLVDTARSWLQNNEAMRTPQNGMIEPEVRVAVVIRILAGASYFYLVLIWHIVRSIVF